MWKYLQNYCCIDWTIQLLQPQAREKAEVEGFEISVAKTSFKANTKALAENEGEGIAKVIKYVKPSDYLLYLGTCLNTILRVTQLLLWIKRTSKLCFLLKPILLHAVDLQTRQWGDSWSSHFWITCCRPHTWSIQCHSFGHTYTGIFCPSLHGMLTRFSF